ncbi:MAG: helix-turn-helix domain-containing protein [Planctomycetota bacterium]
MSLSKPYNLVLVVAEAAETLGVTEGRVRQLCRDGELDARAAGGTWLIDRQSAESYQRRPRGREPKK